MGRCETIVKKLFLEDGLLLTDIEVTYKGKALLQQVKAIINLDKLIIEYDR